MDDDGFWWWWVRIVLVALLVAAVALWGEGRLEALPSIPQVGEDATYEEVKDVVLCAPDCAREYP